ncbi:hypothetical protein IFM89_023821 [Coptis chinensis]|uniref:Transketolase N-terminal domain-containing protein n=1 Tax=Coptis chinensis TaxID=261450 RepID=A0A835LNN1_9MAGN|nr:hypothetical protein IFM89_023821 [Coptis chinensis]
MAISSLLYGHSPVPFLPFKPHNHSTKFCIKFPTGNIRTHTSTSTIKNNNTTTTHASKDHNLSWKNELEKAFGPEAIDENNELFQSLVDQRCVDNIRMLILDSVQNAKAGHPGMALGMAEVGYILYRHVMKYNPKNPKWFNRDRFVLSAGHGCLLQYVCLHLAGFKSIQVIRSIMSLLSYIS